MDLIPRYLHAVRFWLPKRQQDDIIAELSQDLAAQIEDRESALGRPLTAPEIETLLRERGSPVSVAHRYLPQQSLIGPQLFPIYWFVLRVVILAVTGGMFLAWLVTLLAHAIHTGTGVPWAAQVGPGIGQIWSAVFSSAAMVTLVFAVLERTDAQKQIFESWNPRKLPLPRHPHSIPRSGSVIEIGVNLCVLTWWSASMASRFGLHIGSLDIAFAPVWNWFYWGVLVLLLGATALAIVNLLHPCWTTARVVARLALDLAGSLFFCSLLLAHVVADLDWPGASPDKAAFIASQVNLWLARMFPWALAVCLVLFAINTWRLIRIRRAACSAPVRAAAV